MDKNRTSYEWIETRPQLERLARVLKQVRIIGVDLEADSLYHYYEKVCLLQIATEAVSYVLDPLALKDLSPLGPHFSDPRIRKVFHGADYDIRSLYRDFQIEVENLFDTQLACKFLGLTETGLEAVLRNRFQVEMNKKFQRADWSQRPLSREMLEYASLDGRYLVPLAGQLEKELEAKGRLSWVEEECSALTRVRFNPAENGPLYLKVKGAWTLDPRSLTVLAALLEFREALARKADRPPFKIIGNETLVELARKTPMEQEELERIKLLSPKQIDRFGSGLVKAIQQAIAVPKEALLRYPRREKPNWSPPEQQRIKALKKWRERRAEDLALEPGILMSNSLINTLALKNPVSLNDMEGIPGLKRWQQDDFGPEILAAL